MDAKTKAEQANADGRCIICGESHKDRRRGLCMKHYEQYRRKIKSLRSDFVPSWEAALIEAGKLMPNRQGKHIDAEENAFADEFEAFLAENPDALTETSNVIPRRQIADDIKKTKAKKNAETQRTPKT